MVCETNIIYQIYLTLAVAWNLFDMCNNYIEKHKCIVSDTKCIHNKFFIKIIGIVYVTWHLTEWYKVFICAHIVHVYNYNYTCMTPRQSKL